MKIQICKKYSNVNKLQRKLAEAFPDDTIIIKSCIDICNQCKDQPVARAAGKKQKAKSISKLISKIEAL